MIRRLRVGIYLSLAGAVANIRACAYLCRHKEYHPFCGVIPDDALGQRLSAQLRLLTSALGVRSCGLNNIPAQTKDFSDGVKRVAEFDARRMTAAEIAATQEAAQAAAALASSDPNAQNTDKKSEKLTARQKDAQKRPRNYLHHAR